MRLFLIFIPFAADGVQCRTDTAFAFPAPFVNCTDETHYQINKLMYTPRRGAFWYAGQSQDFTFFSSNLYAWNNFLFIFFSLGLHLENSRLQGMLVWKSLKKAAAHCCNP